MPAAAMRSASSAWSGPSAPLASAAAALSRPSQRTTGIGTRSPETGELATALVVSPPQSCSVKSCLHRFRGLTRLLKPLLWETPGGPPRSGAGGQIGPDREDQPDRLGCRHPGPDREPVEAPGKVRKGPLHRFGPVRLDLEGADQPPAVPAGDRFLDPHARLRRRVEV